ncbi:hypothetical protein O6072_10895 [Mycolicibacterium neoaurum]|nr:hypothetical protein [Mycolicibacterium neoaurum]WBP96631.1 hypothetical protein O7W24_10900 [Mycolicibacterium neoaurum]WBS10317.1 hypothetical protein O6072_10895 [Mycolicibacterium neoaurum]
MVQGGSVPRVAGAATPACWEETAVAVAKVVAGSPELQANPA